MNSEPCNSENSCCAAGARSAAQFVGILGAFLVMVWVVWLMRQYTRPHEAGNNRVAERRKALADIRAEEAQSLHIYAWQDQAKGLIRLPVDRAMELLVQEWQDPAAGRSNLLARAQKASAPPPMQKFE